MKVFEVQIGKKRSEKECNFTWPSWWGEVNKKIDVVAYEDYPDRLGSQIEDAICVCDDETGKIVFAKKDLRITELNEVQANTKGREWRPQVTQITDEQAVLLLTAKAARGETLTADDLKALDPDDETPGVGRSKLFDVARIAADRGDTLSEASL